MRGLDKLTPGWPAKLNVLYDVLVVLMGCFLATLRVVVDDPRYYTLMMVGAAFWLVGAGALRLYSPATPRTIQDQAALTVLLLIITSIVLAVWERVGVIPEKHAFSVTSFGVICFVWMLSGRIVLFAPLREIADPRDDILIIGTGPAAVAAWHILSERGPRKRNVVGFLAFEGEVAHRGLKAPILGNAGQLLKVLADHAVDEVYMAGRTLVHGHEMQALVRSCEEVGQPFAVPVHALAFERAQLLGGGALTEDGFLHYLSTTTQPFQYAMKRMMDIVASAAGLLVLSPMLIAVAAAIKATDRGPVFFTQKRVGLHGAYFDMLKFRSMVMNADAMKDQLMATNEMQGGIVFKMKNDPRITSIGRFIRKFSIDELPQLINILRGDMTIVGPRPAVPREVALYKVWHRRRLSVRPGLTCYWQVGGRNEIGFDEWMQLDLRYVDNWNLKIDVELILKTIPVVLTGRGAS
ncbi:MAG: sugar transferase [Deltaproteobacteria bacterium]|nr:sugar transferase [Deltaproteobacteria bacterium]